MLHITLGPEKQPRPEDDGLGRTRTGWWPDATSEELYEANRGCWILGERADRERYALVSFGGTVRQAIEIHRLIPTREPRRRAIEGRILGPGHPVHDAYVDRATPLEARQRNPITYPSLPEDSRPCRCGCGEEVTLGQFASGHDQRALHARVAQIGTVAEFLDWFDAQESHRRPPGSGDQLEAVGVRQTPQGNRRVSLDGWSLITYPNGRARLSAPDQGRKMIVEAAFPGPQGGNVTVRLVGD